MPTRQAAHKELHHDETPDRTMLLPKLTAVKTMMVRLPWLPLGDEAGALRSTLERRCVGDHAPPSHLQLDRWAVETQPHKPNHSSQTPSPREMVRNPH